MFHKDKGFSFFKISQFLPSRCILKHCTVCQLAAALHFYAVWICRQKSLVRGGRRQKLDELKKASQNQTFTWKWIRRYLDEAISTKITLSKLDFNFHISFQNYKEHHTYQEKACFRIENHNSCLGDVHKLRYAIEVGGW